MAFVDTAVGAGDRCLCRLPVSGKGQGQGTSLPTEATQWSPEYVHTDRVRSTEQCHLTCGDLILCESVHIVILCASIATLVMRYVCPLYRWDYFRTVYV